MPVATDTTKTSAKTVLMVVANPGTSELTGWPIGFWISEFVHPWYEFVDAGYEVTLASPDGGKVEIDFLSDPDDESGYSREDVLSRGFLETRELVALFDDTPKLGDLDLDQFDAIVVCGGQGPMYQFRANADLQRAIAHFYADEKPTAAMCHGVSALIDVRLDGSYLIEGKTITGFADVEEDAADQAAGKQVQPGRSRTRPRTRRQLRRGGPVEGICGPGWRLITGQQQFSGKKLAALVISALGT